MRIDFFFNVEHRLHYACRVVRKARAGGKSVLAYARDADRLARFDTALWTFSALDFLPHVYADSPLAGSTPVVLSLTPGGAARDVLLNLDDEAPPEFDRWFAGFERVVEVVSRDDGDRVAARGRVKRYRTAGLVPTLHDVAGE
ncbi:MAG: DNA polymerase III subunit chi [Burkholderiales bacterium]|jgi:DNA polymerase-3 subunit chi|nr:DNA polymerase III subunit chi [Burkholderiales bacterium]MCA3228581.1 DNA polymerase III subunit chi [Burkholderiales bacterium]